MRQPEYAWDEENGVASCTIFYNDLEFYGQALCHPDDEDIKSRLTGQTIAEMRATIWYLRHLRDNELRPQLKILYQLYYSMKDSKQYNKKSYEAKMLYRQIRLLENDLATIKMELVKLQQILTDYINDKESYQQKIKALREKKQLVENN